MNHSQPPSEKTVQTEFSLAVPLQRLLDSLTENDELAFAFIWLFDGDTVPSHASGDHGAGLRADSHLISSIGRLRNKKNLPNSKKLGETISNLPLKIEAFERIRGSDEPLVIPDVESDGSSLLHRDWIDEEQIRGFYGSSLQTSGGFTGGLAVCSRVALNETLIGILNTITFSASEMVAQSVCQSQLQLENQLLALATSATPVAHVAKGASPADRKLEAQIQLAAKYDGPVLITGGSGADSREVARRIHEAGSQEKGLLIPVDGKRFCDQMLASNSALLRRFRGTLFLENIETIPFEQQKCLAQILLTLDGASSSADGRKAKILASITAKNPVTSTDELQHELGCLLSVLTVEIPPLNERPNDLLQLATRFLNELQLRHGRRGLTLEPDELERMQQYPWPGNDRELELALERAVLRLPSTETVIRNVIGTSPFTSPSEPQGGIASEEQVKEWQRENLIACLEQCHWKVYGKDGAAAQAGIKPTTFISRMKKFGIVRRQNKGK